MTCPKSCSSSLIERWSRLSIADNAMKRIHLMQHRTRVTAGNASDTVRCGQRPQLLSRNPAPMRLPAIILMAAKIKSMQAHGKIILDSVLSVALSLRYALGAFPPASPYSIHRASASVHAGKGPQNSTVDKMINTLGFG